eukprot:209990_1
MFDANPIPKNNKKNNNQIKTNKNNETNKPTQPKEEKSSEISIKSIDDLDHLNVVLIGHVDHGKSTIAGQILLQTGEIDAREISKYKKIASEKGRGSWWLAYVMDRDEDERNRGKTVECGKAYFSTFSKRFSIIDAPGHLHYVPNMIIGATMADVAILVISARKGEFEAGFERGGQTREHGLIALTLGISRVIIVINKMDTINWDKKRYLYIRDSIKKFLTKDIGFNKKYIKCLPICGQNGININNNISSDINCKWIQSENNGQSLIDTLDTLKPIRRKIKNKPLRMPIMSRFKGDGGMQLMGMIQSGQINIGDNIQIMPTEVIAKVIGLQIESDNEKLNGKNMKCISAGENVLVTVDKNAIRKDLVYNGCVLCGVNNATKVIEEIICEIYVHEIPGNSIITKGYKAVFHCHNLCVGCEIIGIKKSKMMKNPFLRQHDKCIIKIKLNEKCSLETFEECRVLGRFILRDQNKTVIIGKIKEVIASKSRLNGGYKSKGNGKGKYGNDEEKKDKNN